MHGTASPPGKQTSRRKWIRDAATLLAAPSAASILPASVRAAAAGANGDVRLAFVGAQRRGDQLIDEFRKLPGVRVVAICDVDTQMFDRQLRKFDGKGRKPRTCVDFRRLLDAADVDALVVATPDHWHALMTVRACQAGKDVYVEKPVSHNLFEGRRMVEAARKYDRIVQAGTQNRSDVGLAAAREFLRQGKLGRIRLARGFDFPRRESIGKVDGPQPIPASVDYNLFMGPAPLLPLMRKNLHYDWHFVWPTGTGDCGNRGVHTLDHVRWLIGSEGLPAGAISVGGRFGYDDDGQTPNTQITLFDCRPVPVLWELMSLPAEKGAEEMPSFRGRRSSMVLECEGGYLTGGRGGATAWDWNNKRIEHFPGDGGRSHYANFLEAVRTRKREIQRAEILEGHASTAFCHVANVSYLTGAKRSPAEIRRSIAPHALLAEAFDRMAAHLAANEIDLETDRLVLGPMLILDAETERFSGQSADKANALTSRDYRQPFVVPEEV